MDRKKSNIISNKQIELLIPGYPKGSDLTILDTVYLIDKSDNKFLDMIVLTYRDNQTGRKHMYIQEEPLYTFYAKTDGPVNIYNLFFTDKNEVTPCTCKYSQLLKAIAEVTGRLQEYNENVSSGNSSENRKLHADPNIFLSDMGIENYYRWLFHLSYTNNVFKLSKAYLDIEVDVNYCNNQFPEMGAVPVNAIAYYDVKTNTIYQFIYNDKRNPLVEKYRHEYALSHRYYHDIIRECNDNDIRLDFQEKYGIPSHDIDSELQSFIINAVGGPDKARKFNLDNLNITILFYDDELKMIQRMFELINFSSPDFIECWNMAFDLSYLIARIETLGADPIDIVCDQAAPIKFLKYYIDEKNRNDYAERGDFAAIAGTTIWMDQMIQFASRRKGRGRYQSFKLDAIGEDVAGVRKLDYSHITKNIGDLPYLDMKTFSFYNVMDVIVQHCIEHCTQDLEYIFTKCLVNNTVYSKGHRQSVYLSNRFAKDFYSYGYIIGNNKNKWNEKPSVKFPGAMVGDPLHNSESVMMHIDGKPTRVANNVVDFDYSSLYPSIILENNLAPNTQIGKILIEDSDNPNKTFSLEEHPSMYSSDDEVVNYSRGGEFLENLISDSPLEFGRRWMHLGTVPQVIEDMKEFYANKIPRGQLFDNTDFIYEATELPEIFTIPSIGYDNTPPLITFSTPLNIQQKESLINEIKKGALM